ncbi:type II toxin-antitoxin system Phd/YefM family antitoxin [Thiohalorhabdus methylotrophus]|uniref:Type II toxin-antitoxin system Phd/YefM family antitoxin n=1 Tax=Thiohalorhabdus methylotrophus TaxID=3242694 RepID=A0ABV4U033_9GAMM
MESTIPAQEIKRRGISAVDEALRAGPVHVVSRNRPRYVILSEEQYQELVRDRRSVSRLWDRILSETSEEGREAADILGQVKEERDSWER